jgi:hypothetical protein
LHAGNKTSAWALKNRSNRRAQDSKPIAYGAHRSIGSREGSWVQNLAEIIHSSCDARMGIEGQGHPGMEHEDVAWRMNDGCEALVLSRCGKKAMQRNPPTRMVIERPEDKEGALPG